MEMYLKEKGREAANMVERMKLVSEAQKSLAKNRELGYVCYRKMIL